MKSPNIQLKEIPNKIFLIELQNRLRENKIKEKERILPNSDYERLIGCRTSLRERST